MNEIKLASFRAELETMRIEIIGGANKSLDTKNNNLIEPAADITDEAAQAYDRQMVMEFGEQERIKLRLIEEAIEKMNDGRFGVCSECKEPIPEARLKVIPFAAHCIDCLEAIENESNLI